MSSILIVDDSTLARESLAKVLQQHGYVTATAPNGRDAWIMLYGDLPSVIVLDLMMPQMDGLTFLRLLRSHHHWNQIPVVILTGHTDEEKLLKQARELGISEVIFKGHHALDQVARCIGKLAPVDRHCAAVA